MPMDASLHTLVMQMASLYKIRPAQSRLKQVLPGEFATQDQDPADPQLIRESKKGDQVFTATKGRQKTPVIDVGVAPPERPQIPAENRCIAW